jgi:phenylpyruvate tautomerase PptA (4-oxalocrotonate tautomerase family)
MKATSLALDHLLRAVGDPGVELLDIGPGHPEFERAQTIRVAAGVLAKSTDALPAIAQAIRATDGVAVSPETRAHLAAAEAWASGNPVMAAERYASILQRWPRDLLALRLVQSCYFFLGWHDRFFPVIDSVMPAWTRDRTDFEFVLAMAAFSHAENGDAAYAEVLGRKALANDPSCPIGVHAVAHAMAESGRNLEGAQWMRDQRAHWTGDSRMRTHNAWHLAMFDAEEGNVASALRVLDAWLLPASAQSPLDACDAAALLWRLATEGVDVGRRWRMVSDAFEKTVTPGFWPYVDLHAALAHMAAGQKARAQRLAQAIGLCAEGANTAALRARHITQPGLRALDAWAEGRYGEAARLLAGLQPLFGYAGGSRVQLEIFKSIEHEAVRRQRARHHDQPQPPSSKEQAMPLINVKLIEGVFSELQKKQIAKSLTDGLVQIGGDAVRPFTLCVVEEVKSGDWAVGGQPLTTPEVKAAIAARKVA